jgi:hypothetical protein
LAHLIGLGLALVRLDVDPRVVRPRRLEDGVAAPSLSWCAEVRLAEFEKVCEPDVGRFTPHLLKDLVGVPHG